MSNDEAAIEYSFYGELKGMKGAVNAIIFSKDGKYLISGGDEECVRIWNTNDFKCEQVLHSKQWSQVTALCWVFLEPPVDDKPTSICIGTGRGYVSLCPKSKESSWFCWKDVTVHSVFDFNDAVEILAYDPVNVRLAVASHSGQIKMYSVENCKVTLTAQWSVDMKHAIPRGLTFFGGASQSILILGLETGEMCCRDAQTSNIIWTKTLVGGIGYAALSSDESTLIVDNLTTGCFDVYHFPGSIPTTSFSITSTRQFIKQCAFAEGGRLAACGGDGGTIDIVEVETGKCLQSLRPRKEERLMQAVATCTADGNQYLVVGGGTSAVPAICLWEKRQPVQKSDAKAQSDAVSLPGQQSMRDTQQIRMNIFFFILILMVSYPNWSGSFWKTIESGSRSLAKTAADLATFSGSSPIVDVDKPGA